MVPPVGTPGASLMRFGSVCRAIFCAMAGLSLQCCAKADENVTACGRIISFGFDTEAYNIGDRAGDTAGREVLTVIARDPDVPPPSLVALEDAVAASFVIIEAFENAAGQSLSVVGRTEGGCAVHVFLDRDRGRSTRYGLDRDWVIQVSERE